MKYGYIFERAIHRAHDLTFITKALHFEIVPGGTWSGMRVMGDIGDIDAILQYVDIRAGMPDKPAEYMARFDVRDIAAALKAFFSLRELGKPLFYNGTSYFPVADVATLAHELCDMMLGDSRDRRRLTAIFSGKRPYRVEYPKTIHDLADLACEASKHGDGASRFFADTLGLRPLILPERPQKV